MEWLMGSPKEAVLALHSLFERLLRLSVPSVAALNGNVRVVQGMYLYQAELVSACAHNCRFSILVVVR